MLQARGLQRLGQPEGLRNAAGLYRRAIELVPGSGEAYLRLSECLSELGETEGALSAARKAVLLAPRNGEAWGHLGVLCHNLARGRKDFLERAREALSRATTLLPQDIELWWRLGEVCQSLQDGKGAVQAWVRLGRLHPTAQFQGRSLEDYAWENAAEGAERLKLYEPRREAIMALATPLDASPRHLKMLEDLAREQAEQGFLGHAEESFLLLQSHLPEEPGVWENIALVRLRTNDFKGAMESLDHAEALRHRPRNSYYRALCLMNLGRFPEAGKGLQALLAPPATEPEAILASTRELLVTCDLLEDQPDQALERIKSWNAEAQDRPRIQSVAFVARVRRRDYKEAWQILLAGREKHWDQEVFGLLQSCPPAFFSRSSPRRAEKKVLRQLEREMTASYWSYFQQWQKCLAALEEAQNIAPARGVEALILKSNAQDQLGSWQEAMKTLREAQAIRPDMPLLQNNLGYLILEHGGSLDEASALIQSAMKQSPDDASILDSWGLVLFRMGRLQEAETTLRKAAELNPFEPETRQHLGEVLLKLGREEDALEQWERALAHAFPGRRELEGRVRDLRVQIGKRNGRANPEADESTEDPEEDLP